MRKYEAIKEDRGDYYVEYKPLSSGIFAHLNLIFLHECEKARIADAMEQELHIWLSRFPIPLMVSSYDDKEDNIELESVRSCNYLFGFIDPSSNQPIQYWELVSNETFPKEQLEESYILSVYKDLPYKTIEEIRKQNEQTQRQRKIGWAIIIFFLAVVPVIISFVGLASPAFGLLVFLYSVWKGIEKWLKLTGRWKKSEKEVQRELENTKMKHHHYHCERNPEGFRKLRDENFEQDARNRIQREVGDIKSSHNTNGNLF